MSKTVVIGLLRAGLPSNSTVPGAQTGRRGENVTRRLETG
jgi:hypothetical protein